MNTYDPRDRIVYRHLDSRPASTTARVGAAARVDRLPDGYANGSPRTYLGRTRLPARAS